MSLPENNVRITGTMVSEIIDVNPTISAIAVSAITTFTHQCRFHERPNDEPIFFLIRYLRFGRAYWIFHVPLHLESENVN